MYRFTVQYDDDPMSSLHDPEGNPLPGPREIYEANPITDKGRTVPYEEYCDYFGNPNHHVVLGVTIEQECNMGHWHEIDALWDIDLMDDSPEVLAVNINRGYARATDLPGYLREVAEQLEEEAQAGVRRCPECKQPLTDRLTDNDGRPIYCDTCDREVVIQGRT
jgi:hypothetical protein